MYYPFVVVILFTALAGRVSALDLVVGGKIGTLRASDMLKITDPAMNACQAQCSPARAAIAKCGNVQCFCDIATVKMVVACEQCMFEDVIRRNDPIPDPKAGSTPLLGAYAAACQVSANITIPPTAIKLTLPEKWDGPIGIHLSLGVTIVAVGFGAILGSSLIILLSNM